VQQVFARMGSGEWDKYRTMFRDGGEKQAAE
jgi:hypothetical protein